MFVLDEAEDLNSPTSGELSRVFLICTRFPQLSWKQRDTQYNYTEIKPYIQATWKSFQSWNAKKASFKDSYQRQLNAVHLSVAILSHLPAGF